MHYAVPALLAKAGMLERFYTDMCGNIGLVKALHSLWPATLRPRIIRRLLGRKLPSEIPTSLVSTCALRTFIHYGLKQLPVTSPSWLPNLDPEVWVRHQILHDGFLQANALYTNFVNSDLDVVQQAKEQGLYVVHETIMSPEAPYILREERDRYAGIEHQDPQDEIEQDTVRDRQKWLMSDLILAPSVYVRNAIVRMGGNPEYIALVPYGIAEEWLTYQPNPQRGRVLFVGSVGLRKGSHYLAEATRILQDRGVSGQVRVVGPHDPKLVKKPEFKGPTYVGQVPRSDVRAEFMQADFFVLPTLCEGMATVHLEALACGLPVITTPNCGSVVRDGVEGFIVPIRDAEALADRMEQLLTDDNLRQQLSCNARQRAQEFTWSKYGERLLQAICTLEAN